MLSPASGQELIGKGLWQWIKSFSIQENAVPLKTNAGYPKQMVRKGMQAHPHGGNIRVLFYMRVRNIFT